jgi:hypothetical protein
MSSQAVLNRFLKRCYSSAALSQEQTMPIATMSTPAVSTPFTSQVAQLLMPYQTAQVQKFFQVLHVPDVPAAVQAPQGCVHRSSLSFALAAVLFARLVLRVPQTQTQQYVARLAQLHTSLVLDHGALRLTVPSYGAKGVLYWQGVLRHSSPLG